VALRATIGAQKIIKYPAAGSREPVERQAQCISTAGSVSHYAIICPPPGTLFLDQQYAKAD
jgi:hypothetical protein